MQPKLILILLGCLVPAFQHALAADLLVPDSFSTIQAAIDAADHGDRVLVKPGVYVERLEVSGKQIIIESTAGSAETTIAGDGLPGFLVHISGQGAHLDLRGMTISGGFGEAGSIGAGPGGGVLVEAGSIHVLDSVFADNAGILGAAISVVEGGAEIVSSRFEGNQALHGGAVYVENGTLDISASDFIDNSATNFGGAVAIFWQSAVSVSNSSFSLNTANNFGGAIYAQSATLDLSGLTISGNGRAEPGDYNSWTIFTFGGGGLYISNSTGRLQDSRVLDNVAAAGSGLYLANWGAMEIINTLVAGNGRFCGCGQGAVYSNSSSPSLINSTIVDNGGVFGLFTTFNAFPTVRNSVIAGLVEGSGSFAPIGGNGATNVDFSLLQGQSGGVVQGENNIVVDSFPLLDSSADFGPLPGSLVIDAGSNDALPGDVMTDLLGNPRIVDVTGGGDIVDMGAIEFADPGGSGADTIFHQRFSSN